MNDETTRELERLIATVFPTLANQDPVAIYEHRFTVDATPPRPGVRFEMQTGKDGQPSTVAIIFDDPQHPLLKHVSEAYERYRLECLGMTEES